MSPDIEWHIGEEAEQETIVRISGARRSRRSRWAAIIAIGLGASLGLLYRSIPGPPSQPISPTSVPAVVQSPLSPLPVPESLDTAIERDALRLASMQATDGVTFNPALGRTPQAYADWYAALQNASGRWELPAYSTLYTVYETGTLPSGVTWADVGQFRNGGFFRHLRFYRWQNDRWIWTLPDWSYWKGATAVVMSGDAGSIGPVTIGHRIEDAPVIGAVFERFTRAYLNLCKSLKCPPPAKPAALWTPGLTLTITIQPTVMQPDMQESGGMVTIDLPSPRVVGYYEDANAPGDPYVSMAYATLIDPVVRLASGDYARWETESGGELFLQAIAVWKRAQVREVLHPLDLFYPATFPPSVLAPITAGRSVSPREDYASMLHNESLLPLVSLWDWPTQGRGLGSLQRVAVNEAEAVVAFIADQYGEASLVQFLNALGRAHSLDEAIEAALPISFGEFDRQWLRWIGGE